MKPERLSRNATPRQSALRFALALALAFTLAPSASADRPSLIDLQAALDAYVSPPPAAAAGTIRFLDTSIDVTFALVDLELRADVPLACTPTCGPGLVNYAPVRVTIESSVDLAMLIAHALSSGPIQDVFVSVPSQSGVLRFQNVQPQTFEGDEVGGRTVLEFDFAAIEMAWSGVTSSWNMQTLTGSGCTIPPNEVHVDLAGNAASNLQPGEIEATHRLGLASGAALPTLTVDRVPPHPCFVRSLGSTVFFDVEFLRLWAQNDQFPSTRQFEEELDLTGTFIDDWTLHIESGALREEIGLYPAGSLRLREFSPVDGSVTGVQTVGF